MRGKTANTKHQTPKKLQISNTKIRVCGIFLKLGDWDLFGA
jgi:hypothetical protein